MNRRHIISFLGTIALQGRISLASPMANDAEFEEIFATAQADPSAAIEAAGLRDFAMENNGAVCIPITVDGKTTCIVSAARQPPRIAPSKLSISSDAKRLIVFYEVTSENYYKSKLMAPVWPGGESGVTIGIGYDLGYATQEDLKNEWGSYVHPFVLNRLASVCGKKGQDAEAALSNIGNVRIDWISAFPQFVDKLLPIFVAQTETFCSNLDDVHEDCRGALTSLVFNRGTALRLKNDPSDSRREMRDIRDLMARKQYGDVPQRFLDMQRLWIGRPSARGVVTRRAAEAALFAQGLRKSHS